MVAGDGAVGQQSPPSGCLLPHHILSVLAFGCPRIRSSNFLALTILFLAKSNFIFSFRGVHVSLLIFFLEVLTT